VEYPALDTAVLCLPHNALAAGSLGQLDPGGDAGTQLLAMHATVRGEEVDRLLGTVSEFGGAQIDMSDIRVERWDYVALGHYHIATQLAPNMWYAGAIERTSTNIWIETGPKGFVTWDTKKRTGAFHTVPTRPVIYLPRFSARAPAGHFLEPADVDARIRERVDSVPGGIDGRIVRLIMDDVPRELFRELDHRRLREYRARALHFHLDARRPPRRLLASRTAPQPPRPIEAEARTVITEVGEPTAADVDRDRLADLALRYLASAAVAPAEPLIEPGPAAD
jgi:exonuclease SbcD